MYTFSVYIWPMNKTEISEMIEQKDVIGLLQNIQSALKVYTIKELNIAVLKVINQKADQKSEIDFTIKTVAKCYEIPVGVLMKSKERGEVQVARMVCYAILHYDLELSLRYIAQSIFGKKHHNTVSDALDSFKDLLQAKNTKANEIKYKHTFCRNLVVENIINKTKS